MTDAQVQIRSLNDILSPMLDEILKPGEHFDVAYPRITGYLEAVISSRGSLWSDKEILDAASEALTRFRDFRDERFK